MACERMSGGLLKTSSSNGNSGSARTGVDLSGGQSRKGNATQEVGSRFRQTREALARWPAGRLTRSRAVAGPKTRKMWV
ncbi:hypothetical protein MRX96_055901 [Rhipicephalus microplus]